jgi:hypothetical protein
MAYNKNTLLSQHHVAAGVADAFGDMRHLAAKDNRFYLSAEAGESYQLRLVNRGSYPMLVVVSIDGKDLFSGKTGAITGDGVVLLPHETVTVEHPHLVFQDVARADKTLRNERHTGRIELAVFKQRPLTHLEPTPLTHANFIRMRESPDEYLIIHYDSDQRLRAQGVALDVPPMENLLQHWD